MGSASDLVMTDVLSKNTLTCLRKWVILSGHFLHNMYKMIKIATASLLSALSELMCPGAPSTPPVADIECVSSWSVISFQRVS